MMISIYSYFNEEKTFYEGNAMICSKIYLMKN